MEYKVNYSKKMLLFVPYAINTDKFVEQCRYSFEPYGIAAEDTRLQCCFITEKFAGFPWDCIVDIPLADHMQGDYLAKFQEYLAIQSKPEFDYCIVENKHAVSNKKFNKAFSLCSMYRWQENTLPLARLCYMEKHFSLEQRTNWFNEYQFCNVLHSNLDVNFIFEGVVNREDGLNAMFADPSLDVMKNSASKFLNEQSRMSAFGIIDTF